MGEKRLDFDAPLLSVRRIAAKARDRRPDAPAAPGLVPFTWEHAPGRPKLPDPVAAAEETGRGDVLADVGESLSCGDSSLDCSVSGSEGEEASERFWKDPEVRELMMGRFLPAAKAMATGPLQIAAAREAGDVNCRRSPVRLPYQHRPATGSKFGCDREEVESSVDEEGEEEGAGVSRACGLIPQLCLKSSLLLQHPAVGMKVRGCVLPPRSQVSSSDQGSLTQSTDESWDAVYRYKVGHGEKFLEEESKSPSESKQRMSWSGSQTLDESSNYHSPKSPVREAEDSLEACRRELNGRRTASFDWSIEKQGKLRQSHDSLRESCSMSSSIDRTTSSSKLSSTDTAANASDEKLVTVVNGSNDEQISVKSEDEERSDAGLALSLLSPPLPNSPSESWLRRTLPSASMKYPFSQSLLGIQAQHRKQASRASMKEFKWASDVGGEKQNPQQTRFLHRC